MNSMTNTKTRPARRRFQSLAEAREVLDEPRGWPAVTWGPRASFDGWCEYAYLYAIETLGRAHWRWDHDGTQAAYLLSVGEPLDRYRLGEVIPGGYDLEPIVAMCRRALAPAPQDVVDRLVAIPEADPGVVEVAEIGGHSWIVAHYPTIGHVAVVCATAEGAREWRVRARTTGEGLAHVLDKMSGGRADEPQTTADPRTHLLALLAMSGISVSAFAAAIGSDRSRVADWLREADDTKRIEIPRTAQDWLEHAISDEDSIRTRVGEIEVLVRRTGPRRRT